MREHHARAEPGSAVRAEAIISGSTSAARCGRVEEESDLQAGYVKFQTKQTEQIVEAMRQGNKWTQVRAMANLEAQQSQMNSFRSSIAHAGENKRLESELTANNSAIQQAAQEAAKQKKAFSETTTQYNRDRLNDVFQAQKTALARNVVSDLGANFGDAVESKPSDQSARQVSGIGKWMIQNKLANGARSKSEKQLAAKELVPVPGDFAAAATPTGGQGANAKGGSVLQQPSAAQLFGQMSLGVSTARSVQTLGREYNRKRGFEDAGEQQAERAESEAKSLERYAVQQSVQAEQRSQQYGNGKDISGFYTPSRRDGRIAGPAVPAAKPAPMSSRLEFGVGVSSDAGLVGTTTVPSAKEPETAAPSDGITTESLKEPSYTVSKPSWEKKAQTVQQAAAGMASLDFELPTDEDSRWTLYRFTAPLGNQEITARTASNDLVRRLLEIGVLAVVLLLAWLVVGRVRQGGFHWIGQPLAAVLLIGLGLVSLFGGVIPIVGVAAIAAGCGGLLHRWASTANRGTSVPGAVSSRLL